VYWRSLRDWARWCAERDLDVLAAERVHVERWMRELEELGRRPSTRTGHLSALSGFYAEALDQGAVLRNPAARVRRPRVSHDSPRLGLDRDEARALLRAAERAGRCDHALVSLLLHCGLRVSEAISVSAGDLGTSRGHRVVEVVRKGGTRRVLPLPPPAAVAVELLLEELQGRGPLGPADPLLVDGAGRRLDRFDAVCIVRRLARAAGIAKVVSPHSLRHTFVTWPWTPALPARRAGLGRPCRPPHHPPLRPRPPLPRPLRRLPRRRLRRLLTPDSVPEQRYGQA
jgi:integrase/recombinase XerD